LYAATQSFSPAAYIGAPPEAELVIERLPAG
jgi:hypothetical protein